MSMLRASGSARNTSSTRTVVAIRSMQRRIARLGRKRQSPIEKACGSWETFTDLLVNDPSLDQRDIVDIYWAVKAWHDEPGTWVVL